MSSDLDSVVSGSKINNDIIGVASTQSASAGFKIPFTNIGANIDGKSSQSEEWRNDTASQVNNAMVRGMLESSNGDMDKFNQDYMSYKNALLDMGQEAKKQSDLDGKKI